MEKKPKALRRGLFGVRSEDVQQVLADRDVTAIAAAEQVRAAEERANASEARAAALEAQLAEVPQAPISRGHDAPDSTDPHQLLQAVREEMARVMHATQEAGTKILEHARSDVEQQLQDSERRHREVELERERVAVWVSDLQHSSAGLRQGVADAAGVLNRTMGALQEAERAVARMVGHMADTDAIIHNFQATATRRPGETSVPKEPPPAQSNGVVELENGFGAPEPPVDLSNRPVAVASPPVSEIGKTTADNDSMEADLRPGEPIGVGENGNHDPDRPLASSWAAGPAGRRKAVTEDTDD